MPTYDFRCPKCSHHFEVNLPFGSKKHPLCPQCKHPQTEKLITPPTIHFKGTGFFKTDSQNIRPSTGSLPSGKEPREGKEEKKEETTKGTDPAKKEAPAGKPKADKSAEKT
ncbi:MAG: zinc ribbon domain-containing protein [Candidatus Peribacteraceae bacterium]|jgi:putative FmdB family regulatory protein|nr:zinc ribbon domain-containing protein [Candidatus Peribacteraceae bacterium]